MCTHALNLPAMLIELFDSFVLYTALQELRFPFQHQKWRVGEQGAHSRAIFGGSMPL